MNDELEGLVAFLEWVERRQVVLEQRWIGRWVRLREPFGEFPSPHAGRAMLPAGIEGRIIKVRIDTKGPFVVEFPGFPYMVVRLPEKLELV